MSVQNPKWYHDPKVHEWLWKSWVYYSWRGNYRIILNDREATAWVNMERKLVVCNPAYPYPPATQLRHVRNLPGDEHDFQLAYLEALVAHEAGHTHYTGPLPRGLLGQLVNILEDQRMEWLMRRDFPHLARLFTMAADTDAAHAIHAGGQGGDVIRGCLLHRLTCDHPTWRYEPEGEAAEQWAQVRPLVERSWVAREYPQVIDTAREILDILQIEEGEPLRPDLSTFLDGPDQLLKPKPSGTPTPAAPNPAPTGMSGQPSPAGQAGEPDCEQAGEAPDAQQPAGESSSKPDESETESSETDQATCKDTRSQPSNPTGEGKPADEDEGAGGARPGDQDDDGHSSPEADTEDPGEVMAPGAGPGMGRSRPALRPIPPRPDPVASSQVTILKRQCQGDARQLAQVLNPKGLPGEVLRNRDRGRYRFDRDLRGSERPFDLRVGEQRPGRTHLRLAVDVSSSMSGSRIQNARRAAFTLLLAAQKAGIPMLGVAFDHRVHALVDPAATPTQNLNTVAAMSDRGDTCLAPALQTIWSPQAIMEGESLTIIITDGQLEPADYHACKGLYEAHTRLVGGLVVPILLGRNDQIRGEYEATFGRCVMLTDAAELTRHLTSFIRTRVRQSQRQR